MDAFFRHRDGSFLGGWNQPIGSRVTQQTSYSYIVTQYRSTNLDRRSAVHAAVRRSRRGVPILRFSLRLGDRDRSGIISSTAPMPSSRSNQTLTAAFAYDGERGVLTNHRSTAAPQRPERNNTGTTVQYESHGDVCRSSAASASRTTAASASMPRRAWPPHGSSASAGSNELGATRLRASVGRGIKEPLFIQSYSPSPSFLGNPDLEAGAIARIRCRHRAAVCAGSRGNRGGLFREPLRRSDQPRAVRSGHVRRAVREHRRDARVRPRTGRHGHPDAGLRVGGAYTLLDSKVIRSISSSPIFAPGNQLYRRPRHSGSCRPRSRAIGSAWRSAACSSVRASTPTSISPRSRPTRVCHLECQRRGAIRAPHRRLRHDRQPRRPRLHGAARLSRPSAEPCAQASGRDSDGASDSRDFLERRQGLVRGLPPRTSRVRHRRGHHDVQRRRNTQPIARPEARDCRGASRAAGPPSITQRCAHGTPTTPRSVARSAAARDHGITHVVFGDILFDEHREWAERLSAGSGLKAVEPLWKQSTTDLYREFLVSGTRARIVTVRKSKLDESFLGRDLAEDLLEEFVARDVDPCGERGEYHTVVTSCPAFSRPAASPGAGTRHEQRMHRRRSGAG